MSFPTCLSFHNSTCGRKFTSLNAFFIRIIPFFEASSSFTIHFSDRVRIISVSGLKSLLEQDGMRWTMDTGHPKVFCSWQEVHVYHNYFSLKQLEYEEKYQILQIKIHRVYSFLSLKFSLYFYWFLWISCSSFSIVLLISVQTSFLSWCLCFIKVYIKADSFLNNFIIEIKL